MTDAANPLPGLQQLLATVARLRAPDGCPWDREQTHASLRNHLLEEAYEVYDRAATNVFGDGARQDINAVVHEMRRLEPQRFTDGVIDPSRQ